jgi:hypothetical protein
MTSVETVRERRVADMIVARPGLTLSVMPDGAGGWLYVVMRDTGDPVLLFGPATLEECERWLES